MSGTIGRVDQAALEVVYAGTPAARVDAVSLEVVQTKASSATLALLALEAVRSISGTAFPGTMSRRRGVGLLLMEI